MHVMFQHLVEHIAEMAAFRTIAVVVFPSVAHRFHSPGEQVTGLFDLGADLGEVGQFERRAVLTDQVDERYAIERQVSILDVKPFLREVKGLVDEVEVSVGNCQL